MAPPPKPRCAKLQDSLRLPLSAHVHLPPLSPSTAHVQQHLCVRCSPARSRTRYDPSGQSTPNGRLSRRQTQRKDHGPETGTALGRMRQAVAVCWGRIREMRDLGSCNVGVPPYISCAVNTFSNLLTTALLFPKCAIPHHAASEHSRLGRPGRRCPLQGVGEG